VCVCLLGRGGEKIVTVLHFSSTQFRRSYIYIYIYISIIVIRNGGKTPHVVQIFILFYNFSNSLYM